jgi:uncharacterized protein YunC (DUF1805 family)
VTAEKILELEDEPPVPREKRRAIVDPMAESISVQLDQIIKGRCVLHGEDGIIVCQSLGISHYGVVLLASATAVGNRTVDTLADFTARVVKLTIVRVGNASDCA